MSAKVLKETNSYIKLEITESGRNHFNIISKKYLVFIPSKFDRLKWSIYKNIPTLNQVIKFIGFVWKYGWKLIVGITIVLGGILVFFELQPYLRPYLIKEEKIKENNSQKDQPKQNDQNNAHIDSTNISKTDSLNFN